MFKKDTICVCKTLNSEYETIFWLHNHTFRTFQKETHLQHKILLTL